MKKNHMYDATEIFRSLSGHQKETYFKLAFYLLSFFYYLYRFVLHFASYSSSDSSYRMIVALVAENE